jgi:hypothetical protein
MTNSEMQRFHSLIQPMPQVSARIEQPGGQLGALHGLKGLSGLIHGFDLRREICRIGLVWRQGHEELG